MLRQALQYQRLCGGVLALHEEDPSLSGARRDARGRGLRAARAGRHPVDLGVDDDRPRRGDRRLRGRPDPHPAPVARASRSRRSPRRRRAACGSRPRRRRTTCTLTDEAVARAARHAAEDEPAAAHRGRPPGADRRPARRRRSTASPPTTRRTRARRRRCRSRRRRWARPGWRPRSRRSTPSSSLPGVLPLALVVEQADRRRRAARPADAADRRRRAGRPLPGRPRGELGGRRGRLRVARGELLLRRPRRCAAACSRPSPPGARRLPGAGVRPEPPHERLRPARGRHPLRRRGLRRARPRRRRGRLHHRHVGLPGVR